LKYLLENGCPSNENTCEIASWNGCLNVLKMHEKCFIEEHDKYYRFITEKGEEKELKRCIS